MKKILGIVVLGLLWCNISFSDSYRLFSTEEYLSKKDAEIIFEMSRTEWNKTVKNLDKKIYSETMGREDQGLQWWELVNPGVMKMIQAGYGPGFEEKPMLISFWMVFEDNSIFKKEAFDKLYQGIKAEWLPEYKVEGRYKNDGGLNKNETEAIFIFSKN